VAFGGLPDGEALELDTPLEFEIHPQGLVLLVTKEICPPQGAVEPATFRSATWWPLLVASTRSLTESLVLRRHLQGAGGASEPKNQCTNVTVRVLTDICRRFERAWEGA